MVVTREIAEKIGLLVQGIIQRQIVLLRDPPNASSTIDDGKGSSAIHWYRSWIYAPKRNLAHPRLALRVDFHEPAARYGDNERRIVCNAG